MIKPKTQTKGTEMKNILITTKHRGVFFGRVADEEPIDGEHIHNVKSAKMAIRFGTDRGVVQLAETGPTESSRISAKADMPIIRDVTAVFSVTDDAAQKWDEA
jgi:hypothetical protein